MGMPVIVELVGISDEEMFEKIFSHFDHVDRMFSPYKEDSDISRINRGELPKESWSENVKTIFALSEKTKQETNGYFDIVRPDGAIDPSGMVKGWAIHEAANMARRAGLRNFCIDAGGDMEVSGMNATGIPWRIGIQHPWDNQHIVKVVRLSDCGIATSGTSVKGNHIYNPHAPTVPIEGIASMTVIAGDALEADRFATAAFAMGRAGIEFIEDLKGCEGYMIDSDGIATMTSGFSAYL